MRMIKLRDVKDLGVFNEIVSLQVVDNATEAVVINYKGQQLRITGSETYSKNINLLVAEPKQEVTKYRVKGTYMDMEIVPKVFDDKYDANQYIIEMNTKLPYGHEHTLEVEEFVEYTELTKI